MKVIGDFLGHRHPASTAIYAKIDLKSLREVAALDLEGVGMNLRDAMENYVVWRQAHGASSTRRAICSRQFCDTPMAKPDVMPSPKRRSRTFLQVQRPHRENKVYALTGFWQFAISRGYATARLYPPGKPDRAIGLCPSSTRTQSFSVFLIREISRPA